MTNTESSKSDEIRVARAEVLTEGFKGLLLVNGGGAVALLAFVQAIWITQPAVARRALEGIAVLAFGMTPALLVPMFRYFHARAAEKIQGKDKRTGWWYAYWTCMYASVGFFIVAILYLVVGGLRLLPTQGL